jgi:predicted ester cyclase
VSLEENKNLIRRYVQAIDENRTSDWSVLDEYIAEDFVAHNPLHPGVSLDREGIKQGAELFRVAAPGARHEIKMQVAEGDLVVSHIVGRGVHAGDLLGIPATNKQVETEGFVLEGRMGALLGDQVIYAVSGELAFKPRDQWPPSGTPATSPAASLRSSRRPASSTSFASGTPAPKTAPSTPTSSAFATASSSTWTASRGSAPSTTLSIRCWAEPAPVAYRLISRSERPGCRMLRLGESDSAPHSPGYCRAGRGGGVREHPIGGRAAPAFVEEEHPRPPGSHLVLFDSGGAPAETAANSRSRPQRARALHRKIGGTKGAPARD